MDKAKEKILIKDLMAMVDTCYELNRSLNFPLAHPENQMSTDAQTLIEQIKRIAPLLDDLAGYKKPQQDGDK